MSLKSGWDVYVGTNISVPNHKVYYIHRERENLHSFSSMCNFVRDN